MEQRWTLNQGCSLALLNEWINDWMCEKLGTVIVFRRTIKWRALHRGIHLICINPWCMFSWFHSIWDNLASQSWHSDSDRGILSEPEERKTNQAQRTLRRCCPNSAQMHSGPGEIDRYTDRGADEWTDRQQKKIETIRPCAHKHDYKWADAHMRVKRRFRSFLSHLFFLRWSAE